MQVNVNTDELIVMTNKLEKLHRSAFPSAVRGTLNSLAFNMKQDTLLRTSESEFTNRQKNFFKANSKVFMAKGFNVRSMESAVGMIDSKLKGSNNYAVEDLAQQEKGGSIDGKSLIPISEGARIGKSYKRNVRKKQRLSSIQRVVDAQSVSGKTNAEKFIKATIIAGVNGHVLSADINQDGSRTMFFIKRIKGTGRNTKPQYVPVYTYKKGRKVSVKATHFMEKSAMNSIKELPKIYKKEGQRQINRLMKK